MTIERYARGNVPSLGRLIAGMRQGAFFDEEYS